VAACCKEYEELHWLAVTGTVPLTALLLSTGSYGQEWSLLVSHATNGLTAGALSSQALHCPAE
jgi:hypothetical protein